MARWAAVAAFTCTAVFTCARAADFELIGHVQSEQRLPVFLQGATTPFHTTTEADLKGWFRFRKLPAGAYVLEVGAIRRTVEVGPSLADSKGRVNVTIDLRGVEADPETDSRSRVSVRELSIPKEAWREYEAAQKALGRRDVSGATDHLNRAVVAAPQFSIAWNNLGTIAYQTGQYEEAERDFRKSLEADPDAYAPLVNLGGVLINLANWKEALEYNRRAFLKSPGDALANSQLGMAYFYSGQLDLAEKYLTAAKQIDPAHFSHPQALLAQIYLRRNQPEAAIAEWEDLLKQHPDLANALTIRAEIAEIRQHARISSASR